MISNRVASVGLAIVVVADVAVAQDVRGGLCGDLDRPLAEVARLAEPLGETGRTALLALAESPVRAEALCGMAGLAAVGDRRAIALLATGLTAPALRDDTYRLARWAAFLAAGPEPDLGAAMAPLVEILSDESVRTAGGDDAIAALGEIDHPAARDRLLDLLQRITSDATLDAVIHALARQGDARAHERIAAIGVEALRARSGNATPEQARRLGTVAFYQLVLGPDSVAEGLATLDAIALRDQQDAAAWAVHTLCARAVRRPDARTAIQAHRDVLVAELERRAVSWTSKRGRIGCEVR